MFWGKKRENWPTSEYEKVLNKIAELNFKVEEIKTAITVLTTNYNDLRGKFNRKLNIIAEEQAPQETGGGLPKGLYNLNPFK